MQKYHFTTDEKMIRVITCLFPFISHKHVYIHKSSYFIVLRVLLLHNNVYHYFCIVLSYDIVFLISSYEVHVRLSTFVY